MVSSKACFSIYINETNERGGKKEKNGENKGQLQHQKVELWQIPKFVTLTHLHKPVGTTHQGIPPQSSPLQQTRPMISEHLS